MSSLRYIICTILLLAFLSGTDAYDIAKINVTDCVGRNVTLPPDVERVVSLNADTTRVLVSLGAGEKIVGIDSYSMKCPILNEVFPEIKNITDVGSHITGTLSMERLASLEPYVIFVGGSSRDVAEKIQSELGIPCICSYFNVKTVDDFLCAYEVIGKIVGREERSHEVQHFIRKSIENIVNVSDTIPEQQRPKVIMIGVPLDSDPFKVTIVSSAIDWAGGINLGADVYKGGSPSKTVTIEQIAQWNPDMIFINGLSLIDVQTILNDPTWKQLRAVREGKVYKIYSGMVGYDPAIFVIQPLNLAKIMHPDRYPVDFGEEADLIFERIYGVSGLHSVFQQKFGISEV